MSEPDSIISHASFMSDTINREGIQLYSVRTTDGLFWFEAEEEFAENGNDFWVTVRNFGLKDRGWAGSTTPDTRRAFAASDAKTAQDRLNAFFVGPTDNRRLSALYRFGRGRCLGVKFPTGWITIGS